MDRIELANELINRGTEILINESAGANGARRRFYEERYKNINKEYEDTKKRKEQYERAGYGDRFSGKTDIDFEAELRDARRELRESRTKPHPGEYNDEKYLEILKRRAELSKNGSLRDGVTGNLFGAEYHDAYHYSPNSKRKNNNERYAHEKFHERINNRTKKPQTESISELLVEAVELLDEK